MNLLLPWYVRFYGCLCEMSTAPRGRLYYMDLINELIVILNAGFNWNKARVSCFAKMLLALLTTRTLNLNKIACSMSNKAAQISRYRRLQRFFAEFVIDGQ